MTLWGFLFYYCEMNMKWNCEMIKWWNEGDNKKINWTGELINMVVGSYKKNSNVRPTAAEETLTLMK